MSIATATGERRLLTFDYQRLVNAVVALFIFSGIISVIEPSPYDFMSLIAIPLWFIGGFRVHAALVPILFMYTAFELAGFISLIPYWNEHDSVLFQFQSLYLYVTAVFFSIFFSERTLERAEICLKAYAVGAVACSVFGLISYFDIAGMYDKFVTVEGRVNGTFKDPNVYGSYMILAAAYLMHATILGSRRALLVTIPSLAAICVGVFLSFSRGSWGATLLAMIIVTIAAYVTSDDPRTRRRIVWMSSAAIAIGVIAVLAVLADDDARKFFLMRATLTQEYDEGVTGRFGNQLRSIPMLTNLPFGFGPLRFRSVFELDPHNSFIGAFANEGWVGGLVWIMMTGMSTFVGFRLMTTRSPYRRLAQIFFPALFAIMLQGFQIDIDHWRQLYIMLGAVWGLEAARQRWAAAEAAAAAPTPAPAAHAPGALAPAAYPG
ncbi:MAG: O-antigen ligase family protein [Methylobacteriaceae bacterium]|nr:O-antigen ligase family protein [Methylobacteriaceae bacterium]